MRTIFCFAIMVLMSGSTLFSQINIEKTISTTDGQKVYFDFDHPNVKITTWNKNEISIKGTVKINNGENDDAFELNVENSGGAIYVETNLKNECNLPKMITAQKDGKKIYLALDDKSSGMDYSDLKESLGENISHIDIGVIVEAELKIMVPKNIVLDVKSHFGDIDISDFYGGLNIKNTHGSIDAVFQKTPSQNVKLCSTHNHVDVSIPENSNMNVNLKSSHGEIMTNLDLDFSNENGGKNSCASKNNVVARLNGGGTDLSLVATHNNIYLRKLK